MRNLINFMKERIRRIKNRKATKKIREDLNNSNQLFIDIGSSSIKASIGNEYVTFRASVREVTNTNELTIQNNAICVNGKWYVIGENNIDVGNYNYKYQKSNLNILILYAIKLLNEKLGNIELEDMYINTLLPYNQLSTRNKLQKVINNNYLVSDLKGNKFESNLILNNVQCEGETSLVYFNELYSNKCDNTLVINIGNSTFDCVLMDNIQGSRQEILTINQGTNMLLSTYLKHLPHVPNSSLLGSFIKSGKFKFTKAEQEQITLENELYLKSIWFDIETLIKKSNPYSSNIIITGGGALLLYDTIKSNISTKYNLILPDANDCVYSDLLGLKVICNNGNNDKIELHSPEPEPEEEKVINNISNFEAFCNLRKSGYSLKQIYENKLLELSYGTLKNYNCKYNKVLKVAS